MNKGKEKNKNFLFIIINFLIIFQLVLILLVILLFYNLLKNKDIKTICIFFIISFVTYMNKSTRNLICILSLPFIIVNIYLINSVSFVKEGLNKVNFSEKFKKEICNNDNLLNIIKHSENDTCNITNESFKKFIIEYYKENLLSEDYEELNKNPSFNNNDLLDIINNSNDFMAKDIFKKYENQELLETIKIILLNDDGKNEYVNELNELIDKEYNKINKTNEKNIISKIENGETSGKIEDILNNINLDSFRKKNIYKNYVKYFIIDILQDEINNKDIEETINKTGIQIIDQFKQHKDKDETNKDKRYENFLKRYYVSLQKE